MRSFLKGHLLILETHISASPIKHGAMTILMVCREIKSLNIYKAMFVFLVLSESLTYQEQRISSEDQSSLTGPVALNKFQPIIWRA